MPAVQPQPISGVSAGQETTIETVYPSIAAAAPGRLIGRVCESIPLTIGGLKLSHLLFGPVLAPFALLGYFGLKLFGQKYILTNRHLRVWNALGTRKVAEVALGSIDNVAIEVHSGQGFYQAGDLTLLGAGGDELVTLRGVPRPERFRHVIRDARDARLQSDASLSVIAARQPA